VPCKKLDRGSNVKSHAYQRDDPDNPEELSVAELRPTDFPEKPRVRVDLVRPRGYLEIAKHVGDPEADKHEAGDRHDDILSVHGGPEGHQAIAGHHTSRHRVPPGWTTRFKCVTFSMPTSCSLGVSSRLLYRHWVSGGPLRCDDALTKFILGQLRGNAVLLRLHTNRNRDFRGHPPNVGQRR
jgi:hypothetical protein